MVQCLAKCSGSHPAILVGDVGLFQNSCSCEANGARTVRILSVVQQYKGPESLVSGCIIGFGQMLRVMHPRQQYVMRIESAVRTANTVIEIQADLQRFREPACPQFNG